VSTATAYDAARPESGSSLRRLLEKAERLTSLPIERVFVAPSTAPGLAVS